MAFTRPDANSSWWRNQPDIIQNSSSTIKAKWDEALNENAQQVIDLIDELESAQAGQSGADSIGSEEIAGLAGTTIRQQLADLQSKALHKEGAETVGGAKTFSQSPLVPAPQAEGEAANKGYVDSAAQSKADADAVLSKTNAEPYTPTAPYHPATKDYVDSVAIAAGAVTSVFGRAGAVTAQSGDYTADEIEETQQRRFYRQTDKPAVRSVEIPASGWAQAGTVYTQTIAGVTLSAAQRPDLCAGAETLGKLAAPIVPCNESGALVLQTLEPPKEDLTAQIVLTDTQGVM